MSEDESLTILSMKKRHMPEWFPLWLLTLIVDDSQSPNERFKLLFQTFIRQMTGEIMKKNFHVGRVVNYAKEQEA
jgi:hypothetical protein